MTRSSAPTPVILPDVQEFGPGGCVQHPIVLPPLPWNDEDAETAAQRRAEQLVDRLREELAKGKGESVAKENNDRYDWALDRWQYSLELPGGVKVFRKDRELRLARYLLRSEEIKQEAIGKSLVDVNRLAVVQSRFPEYLSEVDLGEIVDVIFPKNTYDGYWVIEKDGEIDIFRGKPTLRPVVLKI